MILDLARLLLFPALMAFAAALTSSAIRTVERYT